MDIAVFAQGDFSEVLELAMSIGVGEEAGLAIVARMNDVLWNAR